MYVLCLSVHKEKTPFIILMIIITITIIFIIIIVTNFKLPVNLIRVTIHEMYVMENGRDSNPSIDNCSDEISTP